MSKELSTLAAPALAALQTSATFAQGLAQPTYPQLARDSQALSQAPAQRLALVLSAVTLPVVISWRLYRRLCTRSCPIEPTPRRESRNG